LVNRLPPHRRLVPLSMRGRLRITQLECHAILHAIRFLQAGEWLEGFHPKERDAMEALRNKLVIAQKEAQRQSIPKGMSERAADMPGIFDVPSAAMPSERKQHVSWNPAWKPFEESAAGRRAVKQRARHVDATRRRQKALARAAARARKRESKEPDPS